MANNTALWLIAGAVGGFLIYKMISKEEVVGIPTKYVAGPTVNGKVTYIEAPIDEELPAEPLPAGFTGFTSNAQCQAAARAAGYDDGGCLWPSEAPAEAYIGPCYIEDSRHCGKIGMCNCYGWNIVGFPGETYEPVEEPVEEPIGKIACEGVWNPTPKNCADAYCKSGNCDYIPATMTMPARCECR